MDDLRNLSPGPGSLTAHNGVRWARKKGRRILSDKARHTHTHIRPPEVCLRQALAPMQASQPEIEEMGGKFSISLAKFAKACSILAWTSDGNEN